jgi:hypothetical protein
LNICRPQGFLFQGNQHAILPGNGEKLKAVTLMQMSEKAP